MTIQTALEAKQIAEKTTSLDAILEGITFAAYKGHRSWLFNAPLPPKICAELKQRGFILEMSEHFITVRW